jgi:hypothetical protein
MIYVDHGLHPRALRTSKFFGMSSDAIESRLASSRLRQRSVFRSRTRVRLCTARSLTAPRASNCAGYQPTPLNTPGQACTVV